MVCLGPTLERPVWSHYIFNNFEGSSFLLGDRVYGLFILQKSEPATAFGVLLEGPNGSKSLNKLTRLSTTYACEFLRHLTLGSDNYIPKFGLDIILSKSKKSLRFSKKSLNFAKF